MNKGDIVFVQGEGLISKLIRFFDGGGKFSHCSLAVSESKVIEANYDTLVAIRGYRQGKNDEIINLGLTDEQRNKVCESAIKYIGKRYDTIQLTWYVLRRAFNLKGVNKLNNPNDIICSELMFLALNESNVLEELNIKESFRKGIDLTPNELYDLIKYASKRK